MILKKNDNLLANYWGEGGGGAACMHAIALS